MLHDGSQSSSKRIERVSRRKARQHAWPLRVHQFLQRQPFALASRLIDETKLIAPTTNAALPELDRPVIGEDTTKKARGRTSACAAFMLIPAENTGRVVSAEGSVCSGIWPVVSILDFRRRGASTF